MAVLGCIMLKPELVATVAGDLTDEAFHDLRNRNIYTAMVGLLRAGDPISELSVKNFVGDDASVGGLSYLTGLSDATPSFKSFEYFVGILKEKEWLRQVQKSTHNIQRLISSANSEAVSEEIEKSLSRLLACGGGDEGGEVGIRDAVDASIASMEAAMSNDGSLGVPTGFPALNHLTSGLRAGDYWIIAGRPSMGKTSLAMNIAEYAAIEKGVPVGILSMEMTAESLATRMISGRARVDSTTIRDGRFTRQEIGKLTVAAAPIAKAPIFIDQTPSLTDTQIVSRARRMKAQHGIKLLVVDYIQLAHARVGNREQRWREVAIISASLKQAAKENSIAVLALSQLSRDVEQSGRAPRLSDLRESGSLEQDADVVGLLHRPSGDEHTQLIIAKQRNGRTGAIDMEFIPNETRFIQKLPTYDDN
jgi:replicative DNA helicase